MPQVEAQEGSGTVTEFAMSLLDLPPLFKRLIVGMLILSPPLALGHQPVMDMTPRWRGGYGIQVRTENSVESRLEQDGRSIDNPNDLRSESLTTWVEGVYTFRRGFRLTFKMPWMNKRERLLQKGQPRDILASGFGDLILGIQNKYYFNKPNYTGNFSFTPSFYLPTGSTSGELQLGRGTVDYGLSVSASVETFKVYTYLDIFSRLNTKGSDGIRLGNTLGFDMDLGIHPHHDMVKNRGIFLMTGINGRQYGKDVLSTGDRDPNSGGRILEVAPTLVFYWHNWMWRTEYHIPVYQNLNGTQLANSYRFQTGIGIAFQSIRPF